MPLTLRRGIAALFCLLFSIPALQAQEAKTGFLKKTFKNADGTTSPYTVFVPLSYDGSKPLPLLLFLHGAGETKGGAKQPVDVGVGPEIRKHEKTFGCITVIPQSEKRTWNADSADGKRAMAILDEVASEYKTDPARTYLSGLSMGGFGTWSLATAHPERWAAIVPICGGGDPKKAEKIKDIPCWCFHGDKDDAVNVSKSRDMIAALKAAGASPKYTEYPGVGHNSWDKAYATKELWEWLLEQKKK